MLDHRVEREKLDQASYEGFDFSSVGGKSRLNGYNSGDLQYLSMHIKNVEIGVETNNL